MVVLFPPNGISKKSSDIDQQRHPPREPDGIDASMMLARDIISQKNIAAFHVVLGIIPVYNIGGCLNRNSYTRAKPKRAS
jgi:hypothetical protein